MPHVTKRCAIYTRRSALDSDAVVRSSLIQYQKCLRLIEQRGWIPIPELFDDDGWSGANGERPALERLLDRIEQRTFDQLVVYRVDRLTRSFSDWVKLGQVLKRFGVGLSVADGNLDADGSALTMLQLNTLAIFAELEHDMITKRLHEGHASRRARGLRTSGAIPFGYRTDRRTNQLVPVPAEADVVRWMFELALRSAPAAQPDLRRSAL
ncbi:MAG: recombinase family protein [Myxococcota bacterium]|nr:recombinase family protein [Myxococcota bacterium]